MYKHRFSIILVLMAFAQILGPARADTLNDCGISDQEYAELVRQYRTIAAEFTSEAEKATSGALPTDPTEQAFYGASQYWLMQEKQSPVVFTVGGERTRVDVLFDISSRLININYFLDDRQFQSLVNSVIEKLAACDAVGRSQQETFAMYDMTLTEQNKARGLADLTRESESGSMETVRKVLDQMIINYGGYESAVEQLKRDVGRGPSLMGMERIPENAFALPIPARDDCTLLLQQRTVEIESFQRRFPYIKGTTAADCVEYRFLVFLEAVWGETNPFLNPGSIGAHRLFEVAGASSYRKSQKLKDEEFAELVLSELLSIEPRNVDITLRIAAGGITAANQRAKEALRTLVNATTAQNYRATFGDEYDTFEEQARFLELLSEDWEAAEEEIVEELIRQNTAASQLYSEAFNAFNVLDELSPGLVDTVIKDASSLEDLQKDTLRSDELALFVKSSAFSLTTIALKNDGVYAGSANVTPEEALQHVAAIRNSIDDFVSNGRGGRYASDAAQALYDGLFLPVSEALDGTKRIYVIADSFTQAVPFDALISNSSGPTPRYVIDDFEVVFIPALSSLKYLRAAATGSEAGDLKTVAMVSAPVFGSGIGRSSSTTANPLASLSADLGAVENVCLLPSINGTVRIADELRQRFRVLPGGDLSGASATEQNLRAAATGNGAFSTADIVALNTHGLLGGQTPEGLNGEPALALAPEDPACKGQTAEEQDGFLTASEIFLLNIPAKVVLLIACNTSAPVGMLTTSGKAIFPSMENNRLPDPLSGLARAFFAAGAQSVVVSGWDVLISADRLQQDGPAEMFVSSLFADDNTGDLASSIRKAKMEVREAYPHPAAWAPFILVGSGD